jgi:hypothetical protein
LKIKIQGVHQEIREAMIGVRIKVEKKEKQLEE